MFIFLTIVFLVVFYIMGAGITYGYGKHRWPSTYYDRNNTDDNDRRAAAAWFWPFYWTFIWTFHKAKEVTFSRIEKVAAQQVARNKVRIADLHATRAEVEKSNAELEQAEVELEKEIAKS
jgi:hypothetical protein